MQYILCAELYEKCPKKLHDVVSFLSWGSF